MQLERNLGDIISRCVTVAHILVVVGVRLLVLCQVLVALTAGRWHLPVDSWRFSLVPTPPSLKRSPAGAPSCG